MFCSIYQATTCIIAFPFVYIDGFYIFAIKNRLYGFFMGGKTGSSYIKKMELKRHRGTSQFEIPLSVWVPLCQTNRLIGLFNNKYSEKNGIENID